MVCALHSAYIHAVYGDIWSCIIIMTARIQTKNEKQRKVFCNEMFRRCVNSPFSLFFFLLQFSIHFVYFDTITHPYVVCMTIIFYITAKSDWLCWYVDLLLCAPFAKTCNKKTKRYAWFLINLYIFSCCSF